MVLTEAPGKDGGPRNTMASSIRVTRATQVNQMFIILKVQQILDIIT
jgi:hypothetical protein